MPASKGALIGTLAVCGYLLAFRVWDIHNGFPLLSEQVRDWSIAQRQFMDLPLIGPRSLNSGIDIGPVYYWCLWAGRVLLTPFLGLLPHAGGWAGALFETVGDGILLVALWRRLGSWWLAAGVVIMSATAAPAAALSSVIWNPPFAVAFVKLTTASVLWPGEASVLRSAATMVLALCAVQCHASAVLVGIPLVAWSMWSVARARGMRAAAIVALVGALGLAAWAAPYAMGSRATARASAAGTDVDVAQSLVRVASDPLTFLRPAESAGAVSSALEYIFLTPFERRWLRWVLLIGIVVLVARLRDGAILAVSVGPIATAVAIFALWQGRFGEVYWFLVVAPAAALCAVGPIIASTGRLRRAGIAGLLAITVAVQPARAHHVWTAHRHRLPAYGPLARGVTAAAAAGIAVRAVNVEFDVPQGMDLLFMFSLVGGRLDDTAPMVLVIGPSGETRFVVAR